MIDQIFIECINVSRGSENRGKNIVVDVIKESIQKVNEMQYWSFIYT
jgi:hypothetical protein